MQKLLANENFPARQHFRRGPSLWPLQNRSQDFAVLGFRAASMRCRELLERQRHILVDIANYKIGSHIDLHSVIIDCSLAKHDCTASHSAGGRRPGLADKRQLAES